MNSYHNLPQFFYPSQCKAKITNSCTKVVDFCLCTHNPHDLKQVATILNNIPVKWAVDSIQGGENRSRVGENESRAGENERRVGRMKVGWGE